jgi:hypothetical protein
LLPGGGYTPAAPLLHYARAVLRKHGWTVVEVWWDPPLGNLWEDFDAVMDWVDAQAREAFAGDAAERKLLVGKSLGSCGTRLAAERQLPAVWLTPILTHQRIVDAIAGTAAPTLLVGGTGDQLWNSAAAKRSGHQVLEVPDADHGMELANDPVGSVEVLRQVTAELDRFVGAL